MRDLRRDPQHNGGVGRPARHALPQDLAHVARRGAHAQAPPPQRLRVEQVVRDADHDVDAVREPGQLRGRGSCDCTQRAGCEERSCAVHRVQRVSDLRARSDAFSVFATPCARSNHAAARGNYSSRLGSQKPTQPNSNRINKYDPPSARSARQHLVADVRNARLIALQRCRRRRGIRVRISRFHLCVKACEQRRYII
jgi:hypothetical protein